MTAPEPTRLLSSATLARLGRLRLRAPRGAARARREGDARAAGRGGFAEFVDHRPYEAGDDLRRIDWALYARLDRLHVREFAREVAPEEWIVADTSASMAPERKAIALRRLVFAIAFVSLRDSRTVHVEAAGGAAPAQPTRPLSAAASIPLAHRRAADLAFDAPRSGLAADLALSLRALRRRMGGPAGVTVITDLLFDGESLVGELARLRAEGHEVRVLHLLSEADVSLAAVGRVLFSGAEPADGPPLDLYLGRDATARFDAIVDSFVDGWRRVARAHGWRHCFLRAEASEEALVFGGLAGAGLAAAGGEARARA